VRFAVDDLLGNARFRQRSYLNAKPDALEEQQQHVLVDDAATRRDLGRFALTILGGDPAP